MTLIEEIKDASSSFGRRAPDERLTLLGAHDLTRDARHGRLRRAFCSDRYVDQVVEAVGRRRSVLLLGPSGVGKTAVLHELAARIVAGDAPHALRGASIFQVSTSTIMEGARYWGDWEVKIAAIVQAMRELAPAYLYISNIWNLGQSGTSQYTSEGLATILRPYLERGDLILLGEATPEQYRGTSSGAGQDGALEGDPSLMRLFHTVSMAPPPPETAAVILAARGADEARRRGISIASGALDRCLALTDRFQGGLAQPGKAIALLEEAIHPYAPIPSLRAARLAAAPGPRESAFLTRACAHEERAMALDAARAMRAMSFAHWIDADEQIPTPASSDIGDALSLSSEGDDDAYGEAAAAHREAAAAFLDLALAAEENERSQDEVLVRSPDEESEQRASTLGLRGIVTADMVQEVFVRITGLPEILFSDALPLRRDTVHATLATHVIGQDAAVAAVIDRIIAIKAELTDPHRPLGVLLFAGPTGTGKTHLARCVAAYIGGSTDAFVRLDMSEYQLPLAAAGLPDALARGIGHRCFAVILLDEIEKASPEVYDLLLQAFDDGHLASPSGRSVDLRNTLIVLTSNLGADLRAVSPRRTIGYTAATVEHGAGADARLSADVEDAICLHFRPEFVNRLDQIVTFRALDHAAVRLIARQEVDHALRRRGLTRRHIAVSVDEAVIDAVVAAGWDALYGARPIQRAVRDVVIAPLAEWIAAAPQYAGQDITLTMQEGRVVIMSAPSKPDLGAKAG